MGQLDFRQQFGLPNSLVCGDSFLWLAWHANPWVRSEWWLKQSLKPSAFQLWYITFCPPQWLTLNPWIRKKKTLQGRAKNTVVDVLSDFQNSCNVANPISAEWEMENDTPDSFWHRFIMPFKNYAWRKKRNKNLYSTKLKLNKLIFRVIDR